jgi:hypothetical protein
LSLKPRSSARRQRSIEIDEWNHGSSKNRRSMEDAFETLEQNPPIKKMHMNICTLVVGQKYISNSDTYGDLRIGIFDEIFDVDVWQRLGRVVRTCNLHQIQLSK